MVRATEFPEEAELVVCTVQTVKDFGAFVSLDEYGGKEGFIHIAEVATGWIKYIRDYVREGQKLVCKVLRVDKAKGHVDLSLKAVNEHKRREKIQEWKNEQKAEKLMGIIAQRLSTTPGDCYEKFGHALADSFGTLYRAMEECVVEEGVLEDEGFEGEWIKIFTEVAKENIVAPFVRIGGFLEMTCPKADGAVHIKEALTKALKEDHVTVKVQYIGAPRYRIVVRAPDYKTAESEMEGAAKKVLKYLEAHGGEGKFIREEV